MACAIPSRTACSLARALTPRAPADTLDGMRVGWSWYLGAAVSALLAVVVLYLMGMPSVDVPPWLADTLIKVAIAGGAFIALVGVVAVVQRMMRTP